VLAAQTNQKKLVVLMVGILLYLKYTTDILKGLFFLLESETPKHRHLTLESGQNLIVQKASNQLKY
jgi:hypothetical protein